jgi:hypothetical protein
VAIDASTAFFSYSRADSDFALRLAEDLKAAGASVWLDQIEIDPGQRWAQVVQRALVDCPIVIVILSPPSVGSNNVDDEVQFALTKNKRLIPLLYQDCEIPYRLRPFQYADFRMDYARGLKSVLKSLGIQQPKAPNAAVRPVPPPVVRVTPPLRPVPPPVVRPAPSQIAASTTVTNPYLPKPKVRNPYAPETATPAQQGEAIDPAPLIVPRWLRDLASGISPAVDLPNQLPDLLIKSWEQYKKIAGQIVSLAKDGRYQEIKFDLVTSLDEPVHIVSQILGKSCPDYVFYDLPVATTGSRTATPKSVEWHNGHTYDHWVVAGDKMVFVAWRQEATYFYIRGDINGKFTETDGFASTIARGDRLIHPASA